MRSLAAVLLALTAALSAEPIADATTTKSQPTAIKSAARNPFGAAQPSGKLQAKGLSEASGMAPSRRTDDLFWVTNDSGKAPRLYALSATGDHLGKVKVRDAYNRDWEDLASFTQNGEAWLLIADTGDNLAKRGFATLYFLVEPSPQEDGRFGGDVSPARTIHFVFEDGPRDCESVAVDVVRGEILLLTKRTRPAVLYSLPLPSGQAADSEGSAQKVITARRVAVLDNIPRPTTTEILKDPLYGAYRAQPTSMDLSADGRELLVLTYGDIYRYERREGMSWADALRAPAEIIVKPPVVQTEAITFDRRAAAIFFTAEKRHAPVYRYERQ